MSADTTAVDTTAVLVTGATGQQGGATARALLAAGVPVRALGAELVTGDLDDRDSVARATEGTRAVFSVQLPDLAGRGFAGEVEHVVNLIEGARAAGVPQFVHTSVSGAGQHAALLAGRWAWMEPYYAAKAGIQDRVRAAGFERWTLIKPCFFMENLLPAAGIVFPRGVEGGLVMLLRPATRVALVAVADIGAAAAAAVTAPERFAGVELELASDRRTVAEIARVLSQGLGVELAVPDMTEEEATRAGMPDAGFGQAILNEHPQPPRPEFARELGIPLTTLEAWAREHLRAAA